MIVKRVRVGRKTRVFVAGALGGLVVGGVGMAYAAGDGPPERPPYVKEDGTVDRSKLPSKLPVSDSQGNVAGYIDGAEAFPTPPPLVDGKLGKEPVVVVRDANGKQVGVMVPGKGFVPNGAGER